MKLIFTTFSAVTLGCLLPLTAQVTETKTDTEVTKSADGTVTETKTTTVTTFNPEARTKVVKYFDTYKTSPHGLPPAWVTKIRMKEVPAAWRTARIAPGVIVTEKERPLPRGSPARTDQSPATSLRGSPILRGGQQRGGREQDLSGGGLHPDPLGYLRSGRIRGLISPR